MNSLAITRPDDWHVHLRDGVFLEQTVAGTARHFARALVMPNLQPALTSVKSLTAYRQRILDALPSSLSFAPFMTFYLNNEVTPQELENAKQLSYILGGKFYPANATTNSAEGARTLQELYPLLERMQELDLVLQIHGETTCGDIFDRESAFIDLNLRKLVSDFPKLRIVLEHISTRKAVEFVQDTPSNVAATITPHHLLYNRNHLLVGGIKPHYYCLPILKSEDDQKAIQEAAISNNPKFFAGTDSAPHAIGQKENACGCAGIYSAPYAVALYAQVFELREKMKYLDSFLSRFGSDFYQLPPNKTELYLVKKSSVIPNQLHFGQEFVVPIGAGTTLKWAVE